MQAANVGAAGSTSAKIQKNALLVQVRMLPCKHRDNVGLSFPAAGNPCAGEGGLALPIYQKPAHCLLQVARVGEGGLVRLIYVRPAH